MELTLAQEQFAIAHRVVQRLEERTIRLRPDRPDTTRKKLQKILIEWEHSLLNPHGISIDFTRQQYHDLVEGYDNTISSELESKWRGDGVDELMKPLQGVASPVCKNELRTAFALGKHLDQGIRPTGFLDCVPNENYRRPSMQDGISIDDVVEANDQGTTTASTPESSPSPMTQGSLQTQPDSANAHSEIVPLDHLQNAHKTKKTQKAIKKKKTQKVIYRALRPGEVPCKTTWYPDLKSLLQEVGIGCEDVEEIIQGYSICESQIDFVARVDQKVREFWERTENAKERELINPKQSTNPDSAAAKTKKRGRRKADCDTEQNEKKQLQAWQQARDSGVRKKVFVKQHGLNLKDFDKLLDRVRKRKRSLE